MFLIQAHLPYPLYPGSQVRIVSAKGHPQHIREGMGIRIVQAVSSVPYYEVMIKGKSRRWLTEFELALLR